MSILAKKIVGCKGVLVSEGEIYPACIETVSEHDMHLLVPPTMPDADSSPGKLFRLAVTPFSGESYVLLCRIMWSYKTPPGGMLNIVADVMESDPKYKDFYRSIH